MNKNRINTKFRRIFGQDRVTSDEIGVNIDFISYNRVHDEQAFYLKQIAKKLGISVFSSEAKVPGENYLVRLVIPYPNNKEKEEAVSKLIKQLEKQFPLLRAEEGPAYEMDKLIMDIPVPTHPAIIGDNPASIFPAITEKPWRMVRPSEYGSVDILETDMRPHEGNEARLEKQTLLANHMFGEPHAAAIAKEWNNYQCQVEGEGIQPESVAIPQEWMTPDSLQKLYSISLDDREKIKTKFR